MGKRQSRPTRSAPPASAAANPVDANGEGDPEQEELKLKQEAGGRGPAAGSGELTRSSPLQQDGRVSVVNGFGRSLRVDGVF